jgi:hypothetical protein
MNVLFSCSRLTKLHTHLRFLWRDGAAHYFYLLPNAQIVVILCANTRLNPLQIDGALVLLRRQSNASIFYPLSRPWDQKER